MVKVCAHYCGTTILIGEFDTEEQAKDFMKYDYTIVYADEFEDGTKDDIIYADEMFIDDDSDEVPFSEPLQLDIVEFDELPF